MVSDDDEGDADNDEDKENVSARVCMCVCLCLVLYVCLHTDKLRQNQIEKSTCINLFVIVSGAPSNVEKPKVSKFVFPDGPQHNNIEGGRINLFLKNKHLFSFILSRVVGYNWVGDDNKF